MRCRRGLRPWDTEEDDTACGWKTGAESELTKIRVAGNRHAPVGLRSCENFSILGPAKTLFRPQNVVAQLSQPAHDGSRDVLVREEAHARPLSA
jgi:hypothetical protein